MSIRLAEAASDLVLNGRNIDEFVRLSEAFCDDANGNDLLFFVDTMIDCVLAEHVSGNDNLIDNHDQIIPILEEYHEKIMKRFTFENITYGYKTTQETLKDLTDEKVFDFVMRLYTIGYHPTGDLLNYYLDPTIKEFVEL